MAIEQGVWGRGGARVTDNEKQSKGHEPTALTQGPGGGRTFPRGWLRGVGVSGVLFGAPGEERRHFLLGLATVAVLVVIGNTSNVITILHDLPELGLYAPIV